jgi:hypothetical protein
MFRTILDEKSLGAVAKMELLISIKGEAVQKTKGTYQIASSRNGEASARYPDQLLKFV